MASEAQNRATNKYIKTHYYEFKIRFPKDLEESLKSVGGDSLQGYIKKLVYDDMRNKGYSVPE